MSRIIVIGVGLGGVPAVLALRSSLGRQHRVSLIASSPHLEFVPSNPWIAVGWRKCAAARPTLQHSLASLDIESVAEAVTSIDAPRAQLHLRSGGTLDYDYLVVATGPIDAPQAIPGFDLLGSAPRVCTLRQAPHAWSEYQRLLADPGPLVIAAVGAPQCAGPAYEFALVVDADLRARGLRSRAPITFVTCEPNVGHMGLGGVERARLFMTRELRRRQIQWHSNTQVVGLDRERLHLVDCAGSDAAQRRKALAFKYAMIVPSVAALDAVQRVPGLCDSHGSVLAGAAPRSARYPNVLVAGACAAALEHHGMRTSEEPQARIEPLLSALRAELAAQSRNGAPRFSRKLAALHQDARARPS